jgi:hypothetical protein
VTDAIRRYDRRVKLVARAVAKAALAGGPHHGYTLAATGGPLPRRVSALLREPRRAGGVPATLPAALVLGIAVLSAQAAIDGAAEFHEGIETAQAT